MRGDTINSERVLLGSAARTATPTDVTQDNPRHRGVHVVVDVTDAGAATPSITPKIQGLDAASGNWYDILVGAAITAIGTTVLKVYPGITASANASASDVLPARWRTRVEHADADTITYSVGANLLA